MSPRKERTLALAFNGDEREGPDAAVVGQLLIAEDDPDLAQDLTDRLTSLRYEVLGAASSAMEAVSLAKTTRPDLVLMDIQLSGGMDGIEAAAQIRKLQIPFVYVTGYNSGSALDRAVSTEPYGYVVKPYETTDLKIAVEVALHRSRAEREREELLKQFRDTVANLKTLTGRLSICCYCKKVKDGDQWPEIEAYIMQHSNASFTHGMCPSCFERMKKQLEALASGDTGSDSMIIG